MKKKKTGRPRKTEEERNKTAVLSIRLPADLVKEIDEFADDLSEHIGFEVSRNSAINLLVQKAISEIKTKGAKSLEMP